MATYYSQLEPRKNFKQLVSEQLLSCLSTAIASQDEAKRGSNVLVVDDFALGCLNACITQAELFKAGFMTVCPFESKKQLADGLRRRKYPSLDVLYLMRPKKTNLQRVLDDYKQEVKEEKKDVFETLFPCIFKGVPVIEDEDPMYADARVIFLPGMVQKQGAANWQLAEEYILNQMTARPKEFERLQRCLKFDHSAKECPVEFMAYESNLFSLDLPDTLSTVYTHPLSASVLEPGELEELRDSVFDHLDVVAQRLMSACVCLNEAPYVRYVHSSRGIAETVARSLVKQMKAYKEGHPSFRPWGDPRRREEEEGGHGGHGVRKLAVNEPPEAATVIVVDRVDDLAAVLLHDVSYESLVIDLLEHVPSTPFRYTYKKGGQQVEKDVLLDESDPVWRNLRHEDMGVVIDTVDQGVREAKGREARRKELDPHDVNDLRELMSVLTGDEKLVDEKFSQHYRMKNNIVELFESRACHEVVTFEQVLVTGCDAEGVHVSSKKAEAMLRELLKNEAVPAEEQGRLLALYTLCAKALDSKTRQELVNASKIGKRDAAALNNLLDLHVPLTRTANEARSDSAPFMDEETVKRNKKVAGESRRLCRYVYKAEDIVKNAIEGSLPEAAYPWVKSPPKKGEVQVGENGKLPSAVALHGAHGEVVNKYTAAAMQERGAVDMSGIKTKRTAKSKLARADADTGVSSGGGGGGSGGAGGAGGKGEEDKRDLMTKYTEPVRPRLYEGGRIIVFFVGGVSLPEIAALTRLSKSSNREIIVGGTSIMTARDFMEQAEMTDPGDAGSDGGGGFGAGVGDVKLDDF